MYAIGTRVNHGGHGLGTIIDYNRRKRNDYAARNLGGPLVAAAVAVGLSAGVVGSFYNGEDYPYIVKYDSGYTDVYADCDITAVV